METKLLKKAEVLISGKLKKSKSYHSDYASRTYQEILDLAKSGDKKAKQMNKLIEQAERLRKKVGRR